MSADGDLLHESEAELYDQAPCGYLSARPDGLIVKVNQTFLSWLGLEREALIGKRRFQELLSIPGRMFFESHFHPIVLARSRIDEVALDLKLQGGQTLPTLVTGVMKRDPAGAPAVLRLTIFNATERRAYEQALLKKTRELDLLNARKNELLGMAAHDLRTPVGAIYSFSTLLASEVGPTLSPIHREMLDTIIDASAFMSELITDILDVASIESGSLRLARKPEAIAPFLRRVVAMNAMLARKKGIVIDVELGDGEAYGLVDARKIAQVLNNLLGNAIKFSQINTSITVGMAADPEWVTISVRDEGPGIPAEETGKIFTAFRTGSARGTAGEASTGLGLAIAHSIVAGHGGKIWVESSVGAGSTFSFTLPRAAPPAEAPPPSSRVTRPPRAIRVLLADDNGVNQKIGKLMLERLGAAVSLAGSGREALALLDREDFDLVLMDCHMPEMDGYEAAAAIRSNERRAGGRKRTPIIAMTANAAEDDRRRCLAAGMDDFLQKPARQDQLAEVIHRWV